jgi:hypothetical protein
MKRLFYSTVAVLAFSVSGMANVSIENNTLIFKKQKEENLQFLNKEIDCDKIKKATYDAAIAQGAGHIQASFIASSAWTACEASKKVVKTVTIE